MSKLFRNIFTLILISQLSNCALARITVSNKSKVNVGGTLYILSGGILLFPNSPTKSTGAEGQFSWDDVRPGTMFEIHLNIDNGSKNVICHPISHSGKITIDKNLNISASNSKVNCR